MKKIAIEKLLCNPKSSIYYQLINLFDNKYELTRDITIADYIILPICSCTDFMSKIAEKELNNIIRLKKINAKLITTGCIYQTKIEKRVFLEKYREYIVYQVPMENQLEILCDILGLKLSNSCYSKNEFFQNLAICEGCNNKCSFCRVHYSNRPLVSKPIDLVLQQAMDLVKNGTKYINLVGLNTSQYGIDLYGKKMLHKLIHIISEIPNLEGIEVSAFSISDTYPEVIDEMLYNSKVIGVSADMQSGSERILKLMNVGHTIEDIKKFFTALKPKINFTQIITNFPGETIEDAFKTIELLEHFQFDYIYTEKYQNSVGVPSSKLPNSSDDEKRKIFELYEEFCKRNDERFSYENEGKIYVGFLNEISFEKASAYIPGKGIWTIFTDADMYDVNIGDKVQLVYKNGYYHISKILEKSLTKTFKFEPKINTFIGDISNLISGTSVFAIPIVKQCSFVDNFFYKLKDIYGESLESFKYAISYLPDSIQSAFIEQYKKEEKL